MSATPTQTRLQAGMWLPAAADELKRLRDDFMVTQQLHAATQPIDDLLKRPSVTLRQDAEVLPHGMPHVASETHASPFSVIERVAPERTGSPTRELQQALSSEHDSSPVGRPGMRGLLQVANPDPEHPPHTVNERVASDDSGSLIEELQQVYSSPTPGYDWSRHELRGLLQVANPDLEEESSTVNECVVSNNFASLTEELQQIYQSSSLFEDDYPQYELPGILRVANPEQEATRPHAHHENEEEYGDAGYYDNSEEDHEYMDHLHRLRAAAQLPMLQSRHTQLVQFNHHRSFKRGRQPLSRFLGGSCI
jgi:hypothetical protein